MVTGGVSQLDGGVPPSSGTVPEHWGSPRALSRGHKFQVGQEGVNGAASRPTPHCQGFTRAQLSQAGWGCAQRFPARPTPAAAHALTHARTLAHTHARTQLAYFHPSPRSQARPRRAPRRQRPLSCLTSRTTHAPPQRRERAPKQRSSGFLTPPEHITASASAKYAVLCDFDTPPQGHKLSDLQCHTDTRYTCHTLAQTFTNPASPAANAGRVTLSHAACGRDTDRAVFTHRQVTYRHSYKATPSTQNKTQTDKVSDLRNPVVIQPLPSHGD